MASPSRVTGSAQAAKGVARSALQTALLKAGELVYTSMARLLLSPEAGLVGEDGVVASRLVNAAFDKLEGRIQKEYQKLYPNLVASAMLDMPMPRMKLASRSVQQAYTQAKQVYETKVKALSIRAHRRLNPGRTERARSAARTRNPRISAGPTTVNGTTLRYDVPYKGATPAYGRETGLFAASFMPHNPANAGRMSTSVKLIPWRNIDNRRTNIRLKAHEGSLAPGMKGATVAQMREEVTDLLGASVGNPKDFTYTVRGRSVMRNTVDEITTRLYRKHRRHVHLPYNNQRLATAALEHAIIQAFTSRSSD